MAFRIFLYATFLLTVTFCATDASAQLDKITFDLHRDKPDSFKN